MSHSLQTVAAVASGLAASDSWEMPPLVSEELGFRGGHCSRAHGWNLQHNNRNAPDCYPLCRAQPAGKIVMLVSLDREQRTHSGLDSRKSQSHWL